jgi:NitT/TauT family transport system permease protein
VGRPRRPSAPLATLAYTAKLFASESFDTHVIDTLRAFAIAYALSVVIGLAVGFWLGFDRLSGDTLEPMIVSVYAVPKLTLYPILLLAFGLGLSAKVAFGVLHGVIPIILFTLSAAHNTKPILIKTGRVLNLHGRRWCAGSCFRRRFRRYSPACASGSR